MHIAIIPDGLRRWAKLHGITYEESYQRMCERLRDLAAECFRRGADTVTLYLCSIENFTRADGDIHAGCRAEEEMCATMLPALAAQMHVKVVLAGSLQVLPEYLRTAALELAEKTKANDARTLYLGLAYCPMEEVRSACERYQTGDNILDLLWVPEKVDVLVRTGQGAKASSFLPLQCAGRARLVVFDRLFLDTSVEDLGQALDELEVAPARRQSIDDMMAALRPND